MTIEPETLARATARPAPFTPHDAPFWDDPWIARGMLAAHLDAGTDAASRRPETIDRTVDHLARALGLEPGSRLLDLGSGPGLYALRFARLGVSVSGIDLSAGSIAHAVAAAREAGIAIDYRVGDYTLDPLGGPYDAATCVYLDFGVLDDAARDRLLDGLHASLVAGGRFAFDVRGLARPRPVDGAVRIEACDSGFWRPEPHTIVDTTFRFGRDLDLRQHAVIDADGTMTIYRVWERAYGLGSLRALLGRHGFVVVEAWADLCGTPWRRTSPDLAVVASRR